MINVETRPTPARKGTHRESMPIDGVDPNGTPYYEQSRGSLTVAIGFAAAALILAIALWPPWPLAVYLLILVAYFVGVASRRF